MNKKLSSAVKITGLLLLSSAGCDEIKPYANSNPPAPDPDSLSDTGDAEDSGDDEDTAETGESADTSGLAD